MANSTDGFNSAQAAYETPPEDAPVAEDWTFKAVFSFGITLKDCEFSLDQGAAQREAVQYANSEDWKNGLMARVREALRREFAMPDDTIDWVEVDEVEVSR